MIIFDTADTADDATKHPKDLDNSGQILVLTLLVAVVGLTVGLAIAGSSLKNIQQTEISEDSNRAWSAAEAGAEQALLQVKQGTSPGVTPTELEAGSKIENVTVETVEALSLSSLPKDQVAQVNLECDGGCGSRPGNIEILWSYGPGGNPSLIISKISYDSSSSEYTVKRAAFNCQTSRPNGFENIFDMDGDNYCKIVYSNTDPFDILRITDNDKLLRIRTVYASTNLNVNPDGNNILPVQVTEITSTGSSGEAQRTVQVRRTQPVPPSIFDFALFTAAGSISKN